MFALRELLGDLHLGIKGNRKKKGHFNQVQWERQLREQETGMAGKQELDTQTHEQSEKCAFKQQIGNISHP